jgi:Tetratricopeptide repeat
MSTILKSFAELAEALDLDELPDEDTVHEAALASLTTDGSDSAPDLQELLAELQSASATLATIARRDQEARDLALRDLERYDEIVARQREAERAHEQALHLRDQAEKLAEGAFADQARAEAERVLAIASRAEQAAAQVVERWRGEGAQLAARLDLERLLQERDRQQEAEKAKAAEAERARRLAGALARARAALDAGRFEEARELLGPVANENPDNPEVSSLKTIIAHREMAVKADAVEEVLWEVRRIYRRDPEAATARLEAVDVDGLPEPLARQVFGEWARACSRLCRERGIAEPLRYAPEPGRGAVLARDEAGEMYHVVSSLGMGPSWQKGSVVSERQVRRARALR